MKELMMNNLSVNDLKKRINKCSLGEFIKVDENYLVNISLGKSEQDEYCFMVRGKTNRRRFSQTDAISLELSQYDINDKQLVFVLKNNHFEELFFKLILDIFNYMYENKNTSIELAYRRWSLWRNLFSFKKKNILNNIQIQGLIGELYFLFNYMMKKYGINEAVLSWGGADYNKKDFEIHNLWYEIKTTTNHIGEIKISSIEQLDSQFNGYLIIYTLNKSTIHSNMSLNLNSLVELIGSRINQSEIYDVYTRKLLNLGYSYREEYNNYSFQVVKRRNYLVDEKFPKLTFKNTPQGIKECTYSLDINELEKFKTKI